MLKTQHRVNYLKKGISLEVIDRLEEQHNAQQSSKSLQFKNRIRRYDPNDTNIAKLFLMIREQKIGNPKLDKINEIEELLAQVENINDIDLNDGGNTPLHVAVSKKHQNIVGLLLNDHNIDPNIKNNQGDTPLHIAASENNKELVSLLLDKEARSDIKNNEGKAPYELTKNPEIINIFQQKGFQSSDYDDLADQAYLDGELIKIVRSSIPKERKLNDIRDFLQKGANINFRDANCESNTPLHAAVRKQELEVVKLLVQKGAMQIKNSKGKTPLDIAISLNHKDIIQELSGAPFLKRENTGENKPEVSSPKKPKLSSTKVQGSKGTKLLHGEIKLEDSQVNEYSARGSKDALHGNVYQLKLLMLFLKRGLDKGYSFLLATEMTAAEKFDDLVFQYEEDKVDGIGKEKVWRFLQAKHKQDESKKITLSGLLTKEDGEFSLQKYFVSYRKIRQKPEFQGSRLKDFIICTNIDLYDDLESSFSPVTYEDDILNMQPNDKNKSHRFLKLKIDEFGTLPHESKDLVSILKEASDLNRLAKMLAEHVFSSKSEGKGINLRNDLFKQYHVALARGVIDVTAKKFHASFIDNDKLSGEVEKFRKALLKESNLQEQEFKNRMRICTLKISDTFGKVLKIEGDPQITQKDSSNPVQELAKRIVDMIHQEKEGVVTIERRMNIIKDNLDKLAGHVFIKDTEKDLIKFRQGFLNGGTLPGNLDDFRKKLNTELLSKKIEFSQLGQYQLKISNFYTCTEEDYEDKSYLKQTTQTLPNDEVKDEEISEFLGKLVFAVNQPNEVELGKMLEAEISEEFKKKFDYTGELGKYAYDGFQREILNWMKEKKGSFLSIVEVSEFFNEFVREVSTLGAIKEGVKRIEEKLVKSNIMLSEIHSHVVAKQNNERTQKSILFNVCNPSQVFTGRKTELEKLRESIQGSQGVATVISQLVSISGLGGVGKTELVRKHIKEHSEDYDNNIIWVNAETYETMVQSFLKLASELLDIPTKDRGIESIVRDIYAFFAKRKSLFVFDNAEKYRSEDQDAGISQFLPSNFLSPYGNKPSVLITSRNKEWGDIKPLILGTFTEPESIDFIRKALGIKDESQENEIKNLAETLQHFPLALQQAVAYIKERDIALKNVDSKFEIGDYLKRYKEETEKLLDFKFPEDSNDSYTKTTFTTWRITIDKIQDNLEYGRQAKEILDIIAYIAPDNIPAEMFLGLERNREELGDAIQLLKKYSVIDSGEEQSSINIHRLVQQVTRMELEKQSKDKVVKKTFELLKESFPCDSDKLEDYAKRRRLLPHLKAFSSHIDDWLKENPPEKQIIEKDYLVNLLIWAGNEYRNLGYLHKQKECLERALPIFQKYLGDDPLGLAITLLNLGIACGDLGFYQEQKDYIEKAVSIFQQHPDNPLGLARALTNLGIAYGDLDDRQGEKTYLEKAEFILGEHPGGNTLELAKALVSLGDAYGASGDCQKKKKCLEDAVPIFREHHGDNPLELARVLVSLGNAYGALGDRQKKKKCLEDAEFILGEPSKDNPLKVAVILVSLGVGYGALNENEKRKKHLEDAVSIFRQHPYNALELAIALVNLGIAYGASGYHQKKKKCFEDAVSIFRQLPDKPLELAGALVRLGDAYGASGYHQKKKNYLEEAEFIFRQHYGDNTLELAEALANLGIAYGASGNRQKKKKCLKEAVSIFRQLPDKPLRFAVALINLGIAYGALNKNEEGKKCLKEAESTFRERHGDNTLELAEALVNLGDAYGALNKNEEKKKHLEEAVSIFRQHPDNPLELARALVSLGDAYDYLNKNEEGKECLKEAVSIFRQHPDNPLELARALVSLGDAYDYLNKNEEGKECLKEAVSIFRQYYGENTPELAEVLVSFGDPYEASNENEEKKNYLEEAVSISNGGEVSAEKCLPSASSGGGRKKREAASKCLFIWEDVDEFNEEKDEKRDLSKIKIDSEKFVGYIKGLPEEKRSQLIGLADQFEVTGKFQGLINKPTNSQKVIAHLNKVGRVSGIAMHGMMAKNILADFLNGNYQSVAINMGFIAGGQGFFKVAEAASIKGLKLASEGKLLLGRSLKAASPFLARGTSAFLVYDLINQIKEFKNGTEEALVGIVGDSIYLGVNAAEIGVEIAEAFEVLEGVSSFTGPIGATIGAVVLVGTDIYTAVKRVDKIDQIIHLKGNERFIEELRAFIGMQPEQYIQELMEEKQLSNHLVDQGLEYLKRHSDIQRYVFPTGKSVMNRCIVAGDAVECTKFKEDLDNTVLLNGKRTDIKWSRAKPDNPNGGGLFCLPQGDYQPAPSYGSYLCENAIGITDLSPKKRGNYTLINLGEGNDYSSGFLNSPNIFVVDNGFKKYYGGNKDDIFILRGNSVEGNINGWGGVDTVDLGELAPEVRSIQAELGKSGYVIYSNSSFGMWNINKISARKDKSDKIICDYNTKYVDGRGGESNDNPDIITILTNSHFHEMHLIVRPSTNIINHAYNGDFNYTIFPGKGRAQINTSSLLSDIPTDRHNFFFNCTISELMNVDVQNIKQNSNYTVRSVTFSFALPSSIQDNYSIGNKSQSVFDSKFDDRFNITISDIPSSASYILGNDAEIKIGNEGNLYMLQNTNESVDEIIKSYLVVANRLNKMSFFIQSLLSNETVAIGSGNYEVIHNNPLYKSHLVGNGGENVYVIDSGDKKLEVTMPEVVIYDLDLESSVDTIDLRNLVQQARSKLSNKESFELKIIKFANDLLLKGEITELKKTEDSFVSGMKKHECFTVKLKDGVNWHNKTHVILNNVPMGINFDNNEWSLKPLPLVFERDKEIIIVTSQDIEANTELRTAKRAGNYKFVRDNGNDLVITNAFDANVAKNDLCTIVLSKFYETPKMETLSIKFADREINLKDHQEQISTARDVNVVKKEYKDQVYNDVFNKKRSTEVILSDQPIDHKHRHEHKRRHRRHHHNKQDLSHAVGELSNQAVSSSTRLSSRINDLFGWIKSSIGGLFNSRSILAEERLKTTSSVSQVDARADVNSAIMLLDVLVRKITGQKYISTVEQQVPLLEARGYALNITERFEKVVEQAAKGSKISMQRLNIDFMEMEKEITGKIIGSKFNEIAGVLSLCVEKACPGREAGCPGKLSPKKFSKFITEFNNILDIALNQSMQQILHSRSSALEVSEVKEQQISLDPRSYLNNTSVQGHLAQGRNLRLG